MTSAIKLKNQVTKLEAAKKAATKGKNTKLAAKFQSQIEVLKGQIKALNKPTSSPAVQAAKQLARDYKAKYGVNFNGMNIEQDAKIPALKMGRRISQGLKGNGESSKEESKGHVYYEYRENRIDRNAKRYPKLEDGGMMADGGKVKYKIIQDVSDMDDPSGAYLVVDTTNDRILAEFDFKKEAQDFIRELSAKKMMADGGVMAKGGVVKVGDILTANTGVKVRVVEYDPKFGGRIRAERLDEYATGKPSQFMPLSAFKYADGGSLDSILLDTGGASSSDVGGTLFSNADLTPQMDITNPMFAKGGKLNNYKYVPNRMIQAVEVERNGRETEIDGANVIDGLYVKKGVKFEHGGETHRGEGGSMFAMGGIIEHGLLIGDTILDANGDRVTVKNAGKFYTVNLNTGKRS